MNAKLVRTNSGINQQHDGTKMKQVITEADISVIRN